MSFSKFKLGLPSSSSTPQAPELTTSVADYIQFTINPQQWNETFQGGKVVTTVSGKVRNINTAIPHKQVSISFDKISADEKVFLDRLVYLNTKLVIMDDTATYYECVILPSSYRPVRRKSTLTEQVSWSVVFDITVLN